MNAKLGLREWNWDSAEDMAELARDALNEWRAAPPGRAAERRAGHRLAFSIARLDALGVLPRAANGYSVKLDQE